MAYLLTPDDSSVLNGREEVLPEGETLLLTCIRALVGGREKFLTFTFPTILHDTEYVVCLLNEEGRQQNQHYNPASAPLLMDESVIEMPRGNILLITQEEKARLPVLFWPLMFPQEVIDSMYYW
ncbi:hypothetical protein [Carnimonas nigrificans]|uniref:hypothetical protein n=1 Tax=Carnimonas nigrificans TaxID=64323 RepID=UPI00046FD4DB|nr:hypothetical protein [Carnimonas nigrificans]